MSKIEEALKKARLNGGGTFTSSRQLIPSNKLVSGNSLSVRSSSSALIKLMKAEAEVSREELTEKGIILPDNSKSKVTDSFRHLRTQLLQKSENENFIVLVTSCVEGGDSSFVAMNMGAAFSFDESKTSLVIDCDLNSNKLEKMLEMDYEHGLVDFLSGELDVSDIIIDIGIKRLRVIPSGKKNQVESEYFTTDRMKTLLDSLVERYDDRYVVVNSSSISESADASILMDLVDYVVVVVPYGRVTNKEVEKALRKFDKSKLLGVILNDVPDWG